LTNAENAALLHQKIVAQEQAKQREIQSGDIDFGGMLRGVQ
jgi:alpha-D-ribose 1-methylphosphonate 5-triphosphate synthase subunit PhnG